MLCAVQLCWELVQRVAVDGPAWLSAVQSTGLDRRLFELLRAPPKPVPAAAAVFGALAANNSPGKASKAFSKRVPELVAVLASGLSARGSAADDALRYECMLALVPLISTRTDRETAAQLGMARACTLLREADLEAEQAALLDLLSVMCMDSMQHARQITFNNILPRLQQLMRHPDRAIQRSAVRPRCLCVVFALPLVCICGTSADFTARPAAWQDARHCHAHTRPAVLAEQDGLLHQNQ